MFGVGNMIQSNQMVSEIKSPKSISGLMVEDSPHSNEKKSFLSLDPSWVTIIDHILNMKM